MTHQFSPSGFVEPCADGCCREETCATCGMHDEANPDQFWVEWAKVGCGGRQFDLFR